MQLFSDTEIVVWLFRSSIIILFFFTLYFTREDGKTGKDSTKKKCIDWGIL